MDIIASLHSRLGMARLMKLTGLPALSVLLSRPVVSASVRRHFFDKVSRDWEKAWQQGVTPWDLKGTVVPPLAEAVQKGKVAAKGRALVPGCGAGYECVFLRRSGFSSVLGLDMSVTAVQAARTHLLTQSPMDGVEYEVADYFQFPACSPVQFDFIFDYLFFAAIDPPMRAAWAKATEALLAPDGQLATLVFPLRGATDDPAKGPPYPVTVQDYAAVLGPLGLHVQDIDQEVASVKPRKGREWMVYWGRAPTSAACEKKLLSS